MTLRPALLPRLALTLAALFAVAACSSEAPAPTDGAAPATTPATAANAPAPAENTAANPMPARTPGPVVPPAGPAPVAGTDYVEISGGQPFQPGTGKIEVVEVFGYTCPHCADFEPLVQSWAAKLPADVQFTQVPAPFGGFWVPYAKAFYAAESMGVLQQSHEAVFKAIHIDRSLPVQPTPSDEELGQFYAQFGVDAKQFASTMSSFAVNAKLGRARSFLQRSGVESTPNLIVDGKYRVNGRSFEEMLRIADHLIAMQRAAKGTAGDAPEPADAESADAADAGAPAEPAAG